MNNGIQPEESMPRVKTSTFYFGPLTTASVVIMLVVVFLAREANIQLPSRSSLGVSATGWILAISVAVLCMLLTGLDHRLRVFRFIRRAKKFGSLFSPIPQRPVATDESDHAIQRFIKELEVYEQSTPFHLPHQLILGSIKRTYSGRVAEFERETWIGIEDSIASYDAMFGIAVRLKIKGEPVDIVPTRKGTKRRKLSVSSLSDSLTHVKISEPFDAHYTAQSLDPNKARVMLTPRIHAWILPPRPGKVPWYKLDREMTDRWRFQDGWLYYFRKGAPTWNETVRLAQWLNAFVDAFEDEHASRSGRKRSSQ